MLAKYHLNKYQQEIQKMTLILGHLLRRDPYMCYFAHLGEKEKKRKAQSHLMMNGGGQREVGAHFRH